VFSVDNMKWYEYYIKVIEFIYNTGNSISLSILQFDFDTVECKLAQ